MIAVSLTWKLCTSAVDIRTCAEIKKIKIFFSPYLTEEQSVSKWESDTTYPEMEKLLQICELFRCSMDDLLQKDISAVYVEDKAHYDSHFNQFSKMIALGVGLILFGISVSQFLSIGLPPETEALSDAVLFIFVIFAVAIFIVMGLRHSEFERKNPYIEDFYNEEETDRFHKKFPVMIVTGVVLILIGMIVSTLGESILPKEEELVNSVFFLFITAAVPVLVYAGMQKSKYNIKEYNKMHDKESKEYKRDQLFGAVCGCIMLVAFILYLICGFVLDIWGMPAALILPIGGIVCGIAWLFMNVKK